MLVVCNVSLVLQRYDEAVSSSATGARPSTATTRFPQATIRLLAVRGLND